MSAQGYIQLTLFPEDSPASLSQRQENGKEKKMNATYGRKCCGSYGRYSQTGWSGRTWLGWFEARLTRFFPALRQSATPQGHILSRAGMLAGCSEAKESLSWPRPTTGAPLCAGTGNFRQMRKLADAGVISEEERRNLTAVNYVFDFGMVATTKPIKYFKNPELTTNTWHETQTYIMTINNHRFYAEKK